MKWMITCMGHQFMGSNCHGYWFLIRGCITIANRRKNFTKKATTWRSESNDFLSSQFLTSKPMKLIDEYFFLDLKMIIFYVSPWPSHHYVPRKRPFKSITMYLLWIISKASDTSCVRYFECLKLISCTNGWEQKDFLFLEIVKKSIWLRYFHLELSRPAQAIYFPFWANTYH